MFRIGGPRCVGCAGHVAATARVVHEISVDGHDLVHEDGGSTDLAAWVPLSDLHAAPLVGLAQFGWGLLDRQRGGLTL